MAILIAEGAGGNFKAIDRRGTQGTAEERHEHLNVINKAPQAVAKVELVEIEEEADLVAAELEVRHDLRFVNGQQVLNRLELDDNGVADDEIQAIADGRALSARTSPRPRRRHSSH